MGKGRLEIVENKEAENDINDLIKKERAEIKVSNDGKIKRDLNNLKAEKSEKGRYDNEKREIVQDQEKEKGEEKDPSQEIGKEKVQETENETDQVLEIEKERDQ